MESISAGRIVYQPHTKPILTFDFSTYENVILSVNYYLSKIKNVTPIGRYGSFKYNNQDHSILMGLLAAQNLLGEKYTDLWSINTD
jgi:hypothetical protein